MATDFPWWDWETIAPAMNFLLPIIVGLLGVMVFLVVEEPPEKKGRLRKWFRIFAIISIPLAVFGFVAQYESANHQKQFNTDSVRYYQEKFDQMENKRSLAASEIYEYLKKGNWDAVKKTENLDSVLDFFDDLGFYSENKQISDEVLHQEFYAYMRIYCQPAERYIKETEIDESAVWNHVLPLLKRLTDIEASKTKMTVAQCVWNKKRLVEYVQSEIDLVPANASSGGNTYIQSVTNASQSTFLNGIQGSQFTVAPDYSTKNSYNNYAATNLPTFEISILTDENGKTYTVLTNLEIINLPKSREINLLIHNISNGTADKALVDFYAFLDQTNLSCDGWSPDTRGFISEEGNQRRVILENMGRWDWLAQINQNPVFIAGWQEINNAPKIKILPNYHSWPLTTKIVITSVSPEGTARQDWNIYFIDSSK